MIFTFLLSIKNSQKNLTKHFLKHRRSKLGSIQKDIKKINLRILNRSNPSFFYHETFFSNTLF